MTETTIPQVPVQVAVAAIIGDLEGIGKTGRNKEQGYNFRGIDAVLKKVHPLLAKHGVVFAPDVIERETRSVQSSKGTNGTCTYLHVAFTVHGPMGDTLTLSAWGEGIDYGDKSTNKAMTAAFKYAMFQLFAVADPDDDADNTTPDTGSRSPREDTSTTARTRRSAPAESASGESAGGVGVNTSGSGATPTTEGTTKQMNMIRMKCKDAGVTADDEVHEYVAGLLSPTFPEFAEDGSLTSLKQLTKAQASKAIDLLIARGDS